VCIAEHSNLPNIDKMAEMKWPPSASAESLSLSECLDLVQSGVLERLLRLFVVDYVPNADAYIGPLHLSEGDLAELVKRCGKLVVTCGKMDTGHEVSSLSFSGSMLLKTKLRTGEAIVHVQYFGDRLDELVAHAREHLTHSAVVNRGRNVTVVLHFPTCIDPETASATISRDVTRGVDKLATMNAYLSAAEVPRRKHVPASRL